jgi:hypothetical protein
MTITPELIAEKAEDTHAQTQKLLSIPRPFMIRIGETLGASFAYGMPAFGLLPPDIRGVAEEIGFRPLCFVRSGYLPLLIISTPFWVGPEGFVRLDTNADGNFHARALMTDGTDIALAKHRQESTHPMVHIPSTGDFRHDYLELIELAQKHTDATGATPIYMADQFHVRGVFRAFNHLHRPVWAVVLFLCFDALFLGGLVWLAYKAAS